jgi:hypothetical protein
MSSRKTAALAAALTAAALAGVAGVLPAQGQDPAATRTLTFASTQSPRDFKSIDVKPKGDSVGDRFVFSTTLRAAGKVAGRMEGDCLAIDGRFEALDCSLVAILADGSLTAAGAAVDKPIPGVGGTKEQYAVTGGTGAYVGATGVITRSGNGKDDKLTVVLGG